MENEIRVMDKTQSIVESIFKDTVTFSFLIFCIYISRGSTWWTFFTGSLFMLCFFTMVATFTKQRKKTFSTKAELLEWANSLEWPDKT